MSASSRTPSVTYGESFDLQCLVKPRHNPRVPASVTWRFLPASASEGTEFRDLVTFTREGTLQWGEQLLGLGTRTTVDRSHANTNFRLSITRAGRREAGTYQCSAQLWRRNYDDTWSKIANRTSNLLGISVLQPGRIPLHTHTHTHTKHESCIASGNSFSSVLKLFLSVVFKIPLPSHPCALCTLEEQ